MSLVVITKPPTAAAVAQAVFTCNTSGCGQKPTKPCVYSSGMSKGKVRKEGPHAGRLNAAAEVLAALKVGVL